MTKIKRGKQAGIDDVRVEILNELEYSGHKDC